MPRGISGVQADSSAALPITVVRGALAAWVYRWAGVALVQNLREWLDMVPINSPVSRVTISAVQAAVEDYEKALVRLSSRARRSRA